MRKIKNVLISLSMIAMPMVAFASELRDGESWVTDGESNGVAGLAKVGANMFSFVFVYYLIMLAPSLIFSIIALKKKKMWAGVVGIITAIPALIPLGWIPLIISIVALVKIDKERK